MDDRDQKVMFLVLYSGLVAFQFHPGNSVRPLTPKECMALALQYWQEFQRLAEGGDVWPG